jgi:hypothetical protein
MLTSIVAALIYIPSNTVQGLLPPPASSPAFVVVFLMTVTLTGVGWNLLSYSSFMAKGVLNISSWIYWPFAFLLRTVYIGPFINWILCSFGV